MHPSNLREFGARYSAAWCSQDPARVASFFAPDGSLTINGGAPAIGREQIAASAGAFMRDFPDLQVTMDKVVECGVRVEFHWTLTGRHAGTGRRIRISGHEDWQFSDDGLVSASLGYFDVTDYARQVGT